MKSAVVRMHGIAGGLAMVAIATFWGATVVSEVLGNEAAIASVKQGILWGMAVLIPLLIATGASGVRLGGKWKSPAIVAKKRRMPFIALNGVLVLVPSAVFLAMRAGEGNFDAAFYGVQALELAAGAANLVLLGLNMRDGLRLRARRKAV
ncbi:MAG: hypothetical protein C0606_12350 [Hyphomicrobiales bacterium]|nr:MAG: hypothetical protein C0606_12350 [Hyphomicrobiales bacterium]